MFTYILVFTFIALVTYGCSNSFINRDLDPRKDIPFMFRLFRREAGFIGELIVSNPDSKEMNKLRKQLISGGIHSLSPLTFRGLQVVLAILLACFAGLLATMQTKDIFIGAVVGVFAGFAGWTLPDSWMRRKIKERQEEISRGLPFVVDLAVTAMQAGVDFGAAMRVVAKEVPVEALREELGVFQKEMQLGATRSEGLKNLAERVQLPELKQIVSSIVQATEMGASISASMVIQAKEIRRTRQFKAEEKAARAPSLMIFPLAMFIMPAIFIIILTPIMLNARGLSMF